MTDLDNKRVALITSLAQKKPAIGPALEVLLFSTNSPQGTHWVPLYTLLLRPF